MSRNIDRYVRQMRDQIATLEVPQTVEERFGRYRNDPVGFCQEVLGVKSRYPKHVYRNKTANDALIQQVAVTCAQLWLVRELAIAPRIVVTLSDKEVYQRLRTAFEWKTPRLFSDAVGRPHTVQIGERPVNIFPMIHPDISRPIGDGDNRKQKVRAKWAPLHHKYHIPELRALLTRAP